MFKIIALTPVSIQKSPDCFNVCGDNVAGFKYFKENHPQEESPLPLKGLFNRSTDSLVFKFRVGGCDNYFYLNGLDIPLDIPLNTDYNLTINYKSNNLCFSVIVETVVQNVQEPAPPYFFSCVPNPMSSRTVFQAVYIPNRAPFFAGSYTQMGTYPEFNPPCSFGMPVFPRPPLLPLPIDAPKQLQQDPSVSDDTCDDALNIKVETYSERLNQILKTYTRLQVDVLLKKNTSNSFFNKVLTDVSVIKRGLGSNDEVQLRDAFKKIKCYEDWLNLYFTYQSLFEKKDSLGTSSTKEKKITRIKRYVDTFLRQLDNLNKSLSDYEPLTELDELERHVRGVVREYAEVSRYVIVQEYSETCKTLKDRLMLLNSKLEEIQVVLKKHVFCDLTLQQELTACMGTFVALNKFISEKIRQSSEVKLEHDGAFRHLSDFEEVSKVLNLLKLRLVKAEWKFLSDIVTLKDRLQRLSHKIVSNMKRIALNKKNAVEARNQAMKEQIDLNKAKIVLNGSKIKAINIDSGENLDSSTPALAEGRALNTRVDLREMYPEYNDGPYTIRISSKQLRVYSSGKLLCNLESWTMKFARPLNTKMEEHRFTVDCSSAAVLLPFFDLEAYKFIARFIEEGVVCDSNLITALKEFGTLDTTLTHIFYAVLKYSPKTKISTANELVIQRFINGFLRFQKLKSIRNSGTDFRDGITSLFSDKFKSNTLRPFIIHFFVYKKVYNLLKFYLELNEIDTNKDMSGKLNELSKLDTVEGFFREMDNICFDVFVTILNHITKQSSLQAPFKDFLFVVESLNSTKANLSSDIADILIPILKFFTFIFPELIDFFVIGEKHEELGTNEELEGYVSRVQKYLPRTMKPLISIGTISKGSGQ